MKLWNKIWAIEWKLSWHRRSEQLKIRAWSIEIGHKRKQSILIFSNFPNLCVISKLPPDCHTPRPHHNYIQAHDATRDDPRPRDSKKGYKEVKCLIIAQSKWKYIFWVCWTNSISIKHFLERWVWLHPGRNNSCQNCELFCPRPWQRFSRFFGKFSLYRAGSAVPWLGGAALESGPF